MIPNSMEFGAFLLKCAVSYDITVVKIGEMFIQAQSFPPSQRL